MRKEPDEIIRMCSEMNRDAFDSMVERYGVGLYRFVYSLTLDGAAADDLLQETFLKAFTGIGKYRRDVNFESWLFRIARNLFIDRARTEARWWKRKKKNSDEMQLQAGLAPSVEGAVIKKENAEEIHRAVMSLPEKQRAAIALFTWGDFSIAEIAGIMGCSEGTVMSHLHRARRALRELLKDKIDGVELES